MLPTLAGASLRSCNFFGIISGASPAQLDPSAAPVLPCMATPGGQDDPDRALEAAARCRSCPVASACLLEAMRLDAAWRRGDDPWGAYGCWGGVWFSPGHTPTALGTTGHVYSYASQPRRAA